MNFRVGPARSLAVFFCIALILQSLSCSGSTLHKIDLDIIRADGNTVTVSTELALSAAEQERGYMERRNIPDDTGMLFVYKADRQMRFWMENTPSALSIAFIDSRGRIREIYDMQPLSRQTISSNGSVRYALEVPQGWFSRAGIAVGDRLSQSSLADVAGRAVESDF